MGFYNGYEGSWVIKQGGKSYRDMRENIQDGVVTINDKARGEVTKCWVKGNEITESKVYKNGKYTYWVKYGEFEKCRSNGDYLYIKRYHKKTARGLHALQIRKDRTLEGYKGTCYTYYSRGKFLWQKFIYPNGRQAYFARWTHQEVKAVYPNGKDMFLIKVNSLYTKGNKYCEPFIYVRHEKASIDNYSADGVFCEYTFYDKVGRVKRYGKYEENQRVDEWVDNYRRYFYISGVAVSKKLYNTKPEDINPDIVLREPNSQARAMLLKKIGLDRVVAKCKGKVIDKHEDMMLIDFPVKHKKKKYEYEPEPDKSIRILKVVCPTTKGDYFLMIPPTEDFNNCGKARNGTFTGFEPQAKEVVFARET